MKKFINWIGSKKKILPRILPLIPQHYQTYIEPFLGSGALYLALMPKKAIINDHNSHLIQLWKTCLQTPRPFYRQVIKLETQLFATTNLMQQKNQFKNFVAQFNQLQATPNLKTTDLILKNALFLVIDKYSFGTILYRPNSLVLKADWGYQSSPVQQILNLTDLIKISEHFHHYQHQISQVDYTEIIKKATPHDFLFVDPPYFLNDKKTSYNFYHTSFDWSEQEKLAHYLKKIDQQGTKWLYMNYDTPAIRTLFTNFMACSLPSSTNYNSKNLQEIIILNYQIKNT